MLRRFLQLSLLWAGLCLLTEAVCGLWLHLPYPYDYPAPPHAQRFADFCLYRETLATFHSHAYFLQKLPMMYPAPLVVLYKVLYSPWMPMHTGPAGMSTGYLTLRWVAIMLATSLALLFCFRRALLQRGLSPQAATVFVLGVYCLSFPLWLAVHQANMEFVVWVVVTAGIWAFWTRRPAAAAALFGMAAAMKIFPFVFVGLFLAKKQYRYLAMSAGTAAAVTVASLWLVCPDVSYSWQQTQVAVGRFRELYMLQLRPMETGFDHSLFGMVKQLLPALPSPVELNKMLTIYLVIAASGGCALFFTRIRKLPVINQIVCLSVAAILLPPTSFDYTLLHLYAPLALLVFAAIEAEQGGGCVSTRKGLMPAIALLAFLLAPNEEYIRHGLRLAGLFKAVALGALWIVAMRYPFCVQDRSLDAVGPEARVRSVLFAGFP